MPQLRAQSNNVHYQHCIDLRTSAPTARGTGQRPASKMIYCERRPANHQQAKCNCASVRGSHGRLTDKAEDGPLVIADRRGLLKRDRIGATDVKQLLLDAVFE